MKQCGKTTSCKLTADETLFTFLHETEAETARDHITLNFEYQILEQKEVLCRSPRRDCLQVFQHDREAGTACDIMYNRNIYSGFVSVSPMHTYW